MASVIATRRSRPGESWYTISATTHAVPRATARVVEGRVVVDLDGLRLILKTDMPGGEITWNTRTEKLAESILSGPMSPP
ncbi:MAG TPA: hypothetical protein P5186_06115 [Candidatus Paceibacterota bacterium]|nr:hypothetical protein [Verrucomicrobiota bacterium]HRY47603.1 hypothetical protein [Candidatus Paceibacterota bacterium]HSA02699.1 hypothetical protein [Candidatus Paceibacterota bacterium]